MPLREYFDTSFWRSLGLARTVLLAGVLLVVFLFSMFLGMRFAVRGEVIETPALVGMSLDDAERLFSEVDLQLDVSGRRYDASVPEDAIISQVPGPGMDIKPGREVRVIVSMGSQRNPIPELVGTSLRAARIIAEQSGYEIAQISRIPHGEEEETVIAQWPRPGAEVPLANQINLLVSDETRATFVMPSLIGENLNSVLKILEENGFEGAVSYRRHEGIARGRIVRQYPEPGYVLREGEEVNLEVSL